MGRNVFRVALKSEKYCFKWLKDIKLGRGIYTLRRQRAAVGWPNLAEFFLAGFRMTPKKFGGVGQIRRLRVCSSLFKVTKLIRRHFCFWLQFSWDMTWANAVYHASLLFTQFRKWISCIKRITGIVFLRWCAKLTFTFTSTIIFLLANFLI